MNIESYRSFCLSLKGTSEGFPFDETTLVFKVMGKMFALTNIDEFGYVNLKSDPERAVDLRDRYSEITPGYHMSKKHWNSVRTDGGLSDEFIMALTRASYDLVVSGLTKKLRQELEGL